MGVRRWFAPYVDVFANLGRSGPAGWRVGDGTLDKGFRDGQRWALGSGGNRFLVTVGVLVAFVTADPVEDAAPPPLLFSYWRVR